MLRRKIVAGKSRNRLRITLRYQWSSGAFELFKSTESEADPSSPTPLFKFATDIEDIDVHRVWRGLQSASGQQTNPLANTLVELHFGSLQNLDDDGEALPVHEARPPTLAADN